MNSSYRFLATCSLVALLGIGSAGASQMTVNINPFSVPSGFNFVDGDVGFRFTELASEGTTSDSTHILIEGLTPVSGSGNVVASNYQAINLPSGEVQDVGMVVLTLPEGAQPPAGSVTSPIVGIVQRNGAWSNFSPSPLQGTTVGMSSGSGNYDSFTGRLNLNLTRNGTNFTGTASYTVLDNETIQLAPFALQSGTQSYGFEGSTLVRQGTRFYGTLLASDSSVGYDSLLFSIEFVDLQDSSGNGIPDIVEGGIQVVAGQWTHNAGIGKVFGVREDWAFSPFMGFFSTTNFPRIYTANHGWMTFWTRMQDHYVWLHSPTLGWVFADERERGRFRANPSGTQWQDFNFFSAGGIN